MSTTKIEWSEVTWNPTTGCTKISAGCLNCYAEKMSLRLKAMGLKKYKNGFNLEVHPEELTLPFSWKKPRLVFVNSMSDLFHEEMPLDFIQKVFRVMNNCSQHTFQVLTKRANILEKYYTLLNWTPNIWMGVTVENEKEKHRIDVLRKIPAAVKFLSLEPLLSPLKDIDLAFMDWVIVGGESGPKARKIEKEWVFEIKEQCDKLQIPFFFKQWGGKNKKAAGKLLDGKIYQATPEILNN